MPYFLPTYSILSPSDLQGQMMYIPETDRILFQCYPSVMNLDDLTKWVANIIINLYAIYICICYDIWRKSSRSSCLLFKSWFTAHSLTVYGRLFIISAFKLKAMAAKFIGDSKHALSHLDTSFASACAVCILLFLHILFHFISFSIAAS